MERVSKNRLIVVDEVAERCIDGAAKEEKGHVRTLYLSLQHPLCLGKVPFVISLLASHLVYDKRFEDSNPDWVTLFGRLLFLHVLAGGCTLAKRRPFSALAERGQLIAVMRGISAFLNGRKERGMVGEEVVGTYECGTFSIVV